MGNKSANYGPVLNLTIWTLVVASTTFLGLRVWAKLGRGRALLLDDYFLVASLVSLALSCVLQSVDTSLGFGRDVRDNDIHNPDTARLVSVAAGFFLILAVAWSKTSFAITLLRVTDGWPRRIVVFIIWTTSLLISISAVAQWIQCWPVQKLWQPHLQGTCLRIRIVNGYNIFVAAYSGTTDITLALLPCLVFRPLQNLTPLGLEASEMRRKEMIGVVVAMGMGIFAGIASYAKILAIHLINRPNAGIEYVIILMILGTSEGAVTIMAVSIPVLRTLIRDDARHFKSVIEQDNDH